ANPRVCRCSLCRRAIDSFPTRRSSDLLPRYEDAETLRAAERTAISRIHHWDDDSTVVSLWQAGALPTSVKPLFPGLGLKFASLDQLPPGYCSPVADRPPWAVAGRAGCSVGSGPRPGPRSARLRRIVTDLLRHQGRR